MANKLAANLSSEKYVALINNLGSATPLEMSILTGEFLKTETGVRVSHVIGPAPLMTSLDMRGFSISLLPVDESNQSLLAQAVSPAAWPGLTSVRSPNVVALPDGLAIVKPAPSSNDETRSLLLKCCEILIQNEVALNKLDAQSGDGDTGSTVATAARAMAESIDELPLADTTQLFRAIGLQLGQIMGGSSGVLLAIFFTAAGDASASGQDPVDALKAGLERMQQVGGANPGDRTMIDALQPALEELSNGLQPAAAARRGAELTATMSKAKAGRSSYVSEDKLIGHNDPGAEAIALLLEGLS